ncbi:MAG TPA: glycine cleavage system aminomethyltransferase GcvT [Sedimentisphaerales bacterium]|nr:glycine cleavage system aminomethyltransferase GcvT [Sedimentisphaerales bacterium]
MKSNKRTGEFVFAEAQGEPAKSVLYEKHLKLTQKSQMAEFAGYIMPLWYSSIKDEHNAVRQKAGVFDCSHMSTVEVGGECAGEFLDIVTTNKISNMAVGLARYSYILDAAGKILDDIFVYRREEKNFMVVVNAGNEKKIRAYFKALLDDEIIIDIKQPGKRLECKPVIRDMKDCSLGGDRRVDIAIQGPGAMDIVLKLATTKGKQEEIISMRPFHFIEAELAGINCIVAKTGYTGASVCFELFAAPENAGRLWDLLLETGGVACGLGARDSLRIEAGLPLYGHELAGKFNISPFEAGYGWAVKLDKGFFIGKAAMEAVSENHTMKVVRLGLDGQRGVRPVRGHDAVLDAEGKCIGEILSCAKIEDNQIALAYVNKNANESDEVGVYYLARNARQVQEGRKESIAVGEKCDGDITGKIISRFQKF